MTSSTRALDLARARLRIGVLALVHLVVAVNLVPFGLLSYASENYPAVDEWSDLSTLGGAVQWAAFAPWVLVVITPVVSFIVVRRLSAPLRSFWITPAAGIAATVAIHFVSYLFFDAPRPVTGG
ncbi:MULTISPECIES: hypothetical protein [unclassified Rathayibacter]|uniref:hypothetical protein n=1 Tax=unclassified Rathayibacter TaxID=2609250 RepID=UPI000CE78110|nr:MULTISPECIES: hypothetical protein [unclassified Rathayibacter]PPF26156.1 hypothetical protein C5C54_13865 [Rathayibacter sp. AY1F2]PPH42048.1 hypothetical protein C5C42_15740 [Rathayibacter sp. AY1F7]